MTANRPDLDTILGNWIDEGPTDLPDATRRAIVAALPTTAQARRGRLAPWRLTAMNGFGRLAASAVVAVVAGGALLYAISPAFGPGNPSSSPTKTLSPTGSTTPASTPGLTTFASAGYGYTVEFPDTWASRPAEGSWPQGGPLDLEQAYADRFKPRSSALGASIAMAARALPEGTTAEAWLAAWVDGRQAAGPCPRPISDWSDATVAGEAARQLAGQCDVLPGAALEDFLELAWVVDGTGYVITGTPSSVVRLMADSFRPS